MNAPIINEYGWLVNQPDSTLDLIRRAIRRTMYATIQKPISMLEEFAIEDARIKNND